MTSHSASKGFTLIEVMIALFILAVGILGIVGLQLYAKQSNFDAIQRTSASTLATDIVERMRMNRTALVYYASKSEPVPNTSIPTDCKDSSAPCSPSAIAQHDLNTWYSLISGASDQASTGSNVGGLTTPSACIIKDPLGVGGVEGDHQYRIVIAWRGRTPLSNSTRATCGNDSTGARYGNNNEYRRIFVLDAKIE